MGCRCLRYSSLGITMTPKVSLRLLVPQFPTVKHLSCGSLVLLGLMHMSCLEPGAPLEQGFSSTLALIGGVCEEPCGCC